MSRPKYSVFDYGPKETWDQHVMELPKPVRKLSGVARVSGKRFAKDDLDLACMDFSINKLPPGMEVPFRYAHEEQEEVVLVLEGEGQLCLDDELVALSPGTAVRVGQRVLRTVRNASLTEPLYYLSFRAQGPEIEPLRKDVTTMGAFDWDDVLL